MKDQGPRNIGLGSIKSYSFPITAISSILHRITGVLMVVLLPFLLWAFSLSMRCGGDFYYVQNLLIHSPWSIVVWIFLSAVSYHVIAGIRHLIMDLGFGEEMCCAKVTSIMVLVLGSLVTILWGIWIWLM
ncbi:succinate dehydrogenase, cytochrome b556 subunit [Fastidiosibacter lacustris]|uniref:succinate dehydrogenase, cytochrome b556 subunit n=1 Tax=Fastidiosibacter lacustris TaxID=2056695 RepID=UPI000E346CCA|nr:succinate dehydrogenase, cytochrome b556 subunit [Fastidiosibacter lacustris]